MYKYYISTNDLYIGLNLLYLFSFSQSSDIKQIFGNFSMNTARKNLKLSHNFILNLA